MTQLNALCRGLVHRADSAAGLGIIVAVLLSVTLIIGVRADVLRESSA
jgi:hypothetical protein